MSIVWLASLSHCLSACYYQCTFLGFFFSALLFLTMPPLHLTPLFFSRAHAPMETCQYCLSPQNTSVTTSTAAPQVPGPRPARSSDRRGRNSSLGADISRALSSIAYGWDARGNGGGDGGGNGDRRGMSLTAILATTGEAMMNAADKVRLLTSVHGHLPCMLHFLEWVARVVDTLQERCGGILGELCTAGSCSSSIVVV